MTFDVPTASIVAAAAVVVWFLVRLTIFDAIRELRASNVRQGERLGKLEEWTVAHDKVEDYRYRRRMTAAKGNPVDEDSGEGGR